MIEEYEFGRMKVDGREYNKDLIIFPDHIKEKWWRKEGHSLSVDDLEEVLEYSPDYLVLGQGHDGRMDIPDNTKKVIRNKGIQLISGKTGEVIEKYNKLSSENTVGAFHLTC